MVTLRVIRPGLLTTVQDLGRWGRQASGVSVAGAMDPFSHRLANALVRNPPGAATLEVTLLGPILEFDDERQVAVAGARFDVSVDGEAVEADKMPIQVRAGSRMQFGERRFGSRAYLAVEGGVDTPPVFGSRATHLPSGMGGLGGRRLAAGDSLPLGARPPSPKAREGALMREVTAALRACERLQRDSAGEDRLHGRVRVLGGRHRDRFASDAMAALQSAPYVIGQASNRMGFRLDGPALQMASAANLLSEATPVGSLQVPASGQPILLTADRQTTGGYPRIASVIAADMGIVGQLGPGDIVSFELVSPDDAIGALRSAERELMTLERSLQ
jgi:antagonist of KipI